MASKFSDMLRGLAAPRANESGAGSVLPISYKNDGTAGWGVPEWGRELLRGVADINDVFAAPRKWQAETGGKAFSPALLGALMGLGGGAGAAFGPKVAGTEMLSGVFAGKGARTANMKLANTALDILEDLPDGLTLDQTNTPLVNLTGWMLGPEAALRFEIPDPKQQLRLPFLRRAEMGPEARPGWERAGDGLDPGVQRVPEGGTTLGAVMDHPELFEAYPTLREVRLEHMPSPDFQRRGQYHQGKIKAGPTTPENMQKVVMHEVQHAIQDLEGFAPGGAPGMFLSQPVRAGLYESDIAENTLRSMLRGLDPNTQLRVMIGEDDAIRALPKGYQLPVHELLTKIQQGDKVRGMSHQLYRQLAGETEARNVETRLGKSPRDAMPWETQDVPYDAQIVRAGSRFYDTDGNLLPSFEPEFLAILRGLK